MEIYIADTKRISPEVEAELFTFHPEKYPLVTWVPLGDIENWKDSYVEDAATLLKATPIVMILWYRDHRNTVEVASQRVYEHFLRKE